MTTPQYRGSFPVLVTAFKEGTCAFDEAAMRRFVDWQVAEGSHGIVTLGSMGEFFLVDDADRRRIVRAVVDQAAKRIPVFVGTMSTRTENAARYSAEAEEIGADGLMITPPFYLVPSDDEIFAYYEQICARVRIPIMLYNNPTTTNVDMSAKLVARLAHAFPQIRYIKEASGDLARGYDIRRLCGDKMNVWQGARPFESTFVGGNGWVSPEGNFAPKLSARMYDHLFAGQIDAAERIRDVLVAVNDLIKGV